MVVGGSGRCLQRLKWTLLPQRLHKYSRVILLFGLFVSAFVVLNISNKATSSSASSELNDKTDSESELSSKKQEFESINIDNAAGDRQRIDWHNYGQQAADEKRTGPGEQGAAFRLPADAETKRKSEQLYRVNGFNALASDSIPLNRSVKDIRHKGCRKQLYPANLPTVSVILPVFNEHWSTLLRSVYSIINRSPKKLLKEVILADDHSSKAFLGEQLDEYVKEHWPDGLVKVVRAPDRDGLIRARLIGARIATADVLLFLDSHSECNFNWLPPLLEPIALDRKTAVCPFVDVIDYETFEYRAQDEGARGAFDWELYYKRLPLLPEDLANPTRPFDNPVMAGGYFAIDRKWFWELGGYDEGLLIWGGEQYELSFKIWQCGGRLVDAPCSRVGHIYRKFSPFPSGGKGDYLGRNYKRVAEVWMDEYKEFLYARRPHYRNSNAGDMTEVKATRERLQCKSFKWFMEEVAFDLTDKYPPVEPEAGCEGEIRNMADDKYCVDAQFKGQNDPVQLRRCVSDNAEGGGEQNFQYTYHYDLRPKGRLMCFDVPHGGERAPVLLYSCHGGLGNQEWTYDSVSHQLRHPLTKTCLDCDVDTHQLFIMPCDKSRLSQQWKWTTVRQDVLDRPRPKKGNRHRKA